MNYTIHTDGGSRGNPGPAAIGVIIKKGDTLVTQFGKYLGTTTNNVAEYTAVKEAMMFLTTHPEMEKAAVQFVLDSELVVRQLNGIYKIKDSHLKTLAVSINNLIEEWGSTVHFNHVKRIHNQDADSIVNKTLDTSLSL